MMDKLKDILDRELKYLTQGTDEFCYVDYILNEIKNYFLNKLPKEKKFDSMTNSSKESIKNAEIYNKCLNQIKEIIKKG